jgi:hypothetical protein
VAGALWFTNFASIQQRRFPSSIEKVVSKILSPFISTKLPVRSNNPEMASPSQHRPANRPDMATELARESNSRASISQESIDLLVSMGFERERATAVLRRVGGDMERAVQALL